MKTLFIEARSNTAIQLPSTALKKLPKKIALFMPVQHIHKRKSVINQLKDAGISVISSKSKHAKHQSQVLGCHAPADPDQLKDAAAILFIGSGKFHPIALESHNIPVFCYDIRSKKIYKTKTDPALKKKLETRKKAALTRFYSSDRIGIIISVKPGQKRPDLAARLSKSFPEKTFYIFAADIIDLGSLENFPFIQSWINTACPRIVDDADHPLGKRIINARDIPINPAIKF